MSLPDWHSRGYIPHWEAGEEPQSICFRLADSLPRHVLKPSLADLPDEPASLHRRRAIEEALDAGHGEALLVRPEIGAIVQDALLHFDGERCRLHAWCIMPNHVHVMATPLAEHSLAALVHSWKSFTASRINQLLGRTGALWYREYFDRKIRNERHFAEASHYIEMNPVKAGFCKAPEAWPFSSAGTGYHSTR